MSAPKFLSSHHEQALCSSLTETHPLHHYCKQTLRHGKLQHALAGSVLGSLGPRLASRRPWWYLQVDHSSWTCQTIAHWWPGSLGQPSRKIVQSLLISAGLNARRRMSSPRMPFMHWFGTPHELRPPARCQYPFSNSLRPRLPSNSSHLTT